MRIVFVLTRFIVGGSEAYVFEKAKWLKQRGYDCLVMSSGGENASILEGVVDHLIISNLDKNPLSISRWEYKQVQQDIINGLGPFRATHIECFELNPAKYIFSIIGGIDLDIRVNMMVLSELGFKRDFALQISAKYFERSNLLYTLNSGMSLHINEDSILKLTFGLINIPIEDNHQKDSVVNSHHPYILSVARLSYDKEYIIELVEAFGRVASCIPDTRLLLIGDGPNRTTIKKKIDALDASIKDRISLLGSLSKENTVSYIKGCSLFVGMGTSLLQAASYNKLCLVTSPIEGWRRGTIGLYSTKMAGGFGQLYPGAKLDAFDGYLISVFQRKELFESSSLNTMLLFHDSTAIYEEWLEVYNNAQGRSKHYQFYAYLFKFYMASHRFYRFIFR